jgi:hypothetical protein
MAVVPVTINGVAYPKNKKDPPFAVTIVGYAWVTGLTVGGGPVVPPDPNAPHPSHPVALPGDPWWGADLTPEHPIVLPPVDVSPPEVPTTPTEPKPPPPDGGWGWSPTYGWGYFPPEGAATPKK